MNKNRVRVVLVETTHAGNIGAAARAMKTMGLGELSLVRPREYQNHECYARASGAEDIIDRASVHSSLQSALEDASWVIGTSARLRSLKWPQFDAREAAEKVVEHSQAGTVAIVFGRESSGLSNDELGRCSALLTIPTANDFSSLNLGAAVQVICYEVMMASSNPGAASGSDNAGDASDAPAQQGEIEGFYQHMTEAMTRVDFFNPENPRLLEGRLRRLFNRSGLLKSEVQLLRGFFAAIEKKVR
jgi:TrmH family RNA methyltransferase